MAQYTGVTEKKNISVTGDSFKSYIKDIVRLYCYKFLYSREYLNENAYKNNIRELLTPENLMFRYFNLKLHGSIIIAVQVIQALILSSFPG